MRTSRREKIRKGDLTKREMLLLMLGMSGDMAKADLEDMMETAPVYYRMLGDSKRRGLVSNVRKDKLTSYRLTIAGEKMFDQMFPGVFRKNRGADGERESLCKNTDRRMRRCMIGGIIYNMYISGINMFAGERPEILTDADFRMEKIKEKGNCFYLRDEYNKVLRKEVASSRSCGLLFVPESQEVYVVYNMMDRNIEIYKRVEEKMYNEIDIIARSMKRENSEEKGKYSVSALIMGDSYDLISKILENGKHNASYQYVQIEDKQKVSRITADMDYQRMYFVLNRAAGNLGMRLLTNPKEYEKLKGKMAQLLGVLPRTSVNDGFTNSGESVHICMLPELKKLTYIKGEANERYIICLDSQLALYKNLFGTNGVTYHSMADEKVAELMRKLTGK